MLVLEDWAQGLTMRDADIDAERNIILEEARLGKGANVYLGSAELAAICSKLGRIPTKAEYLADMGVLTAASDKVYQYLNFDKIEDYTASAATVKDGVAA